MNVRTLLIACALLAASAAFGRVKAPTGGITLDGRLDEADWTTADWEGGFVKIGNVARQKGDVKPAAATEFAMLADATTLYVGVRCHEPKMPKEYVIESLWCVDAVEVLLSPTGRTFDFYHFAVPLFTDQRFQTYWAESGNIQPDPYVPEWKAVVWRGENLWSVEFAIPLTAFYMTRNDAWNTTWLVNVARSNPQHNELTSWAKVLNSYKEIERFRKIEGFPVRDPKDDVAILSAVSEITNSVDGVHRGVLTCDIRAKVAGAFALTASCGASEDVTLNAGLNKVKVPCAFPGNGRHAVKFVLTRKGGGRAYVREYPVTVDFEFFRVKLTSPQYRNNFYPGQDASRVAGLVRSARPGAVTVTLEGPGVPRQKRTLPAGGGAFEFATPGFAEGDAVLIVSAGGDSKRVKVRKLAPSGHRMTWIADGNLVVNGRPTLRRNFYAKHYLGGRQFREKYDADDLHETPEFYGSRNLQVGDLIRGAEQREAILDAPPGKEVLAKVDEILEKASHEDFAFYYISDEPECRGVSAVYLRHLYDYVAARDPYHVISMATRGGTRFIECADLFETHPYLNPYYEDGQRRYDRAPNTLGDYVECFSSLNRPDKCIGFLPTAFSYAGAAYIDFREYVMHVWAAMIRGGKTLWPFAYLGLGARASIYEGSRYIFTTFERLEDFILFGRRETLARTPEYESVSYTTSSNRLFVCVNLSTERRKVSVPWAFGRLHEFRGNRTFEPDGGQVRLALEPLETIVATSVECDGGLPTYAETQGKVDQAEYARTHRDNQLFERELDIEVVSSSPNGEGYRSLFDGVLDTLGGFEGWFERHHPEGFFEMSFPKFTPEFSRIRVFGFNIGGMRVKARRFGRWDDLVPVKVREEKYCLEYEFGETVRPVKLRLEFPRPNKKEWVELYEIELPGKAVERKKSAERRPSVFVNATTNSVVEIGGDNRYFVLDVLSAKRRDAHKYTGFTVQFTRVGGVLASVNGLESGLYTIRLPDKARERHGMCLYDYNLDVALASLRFEKEPENRIEIEVEKAGKTIAPGDTIRVKVVLKEPCADVSGVFRRDWGRGPDVFSVNGTDALELKAADDSGRVWISETKVGSCGVSKPREVSLKVTTLGGALDTPLFTTFAEGFGEAR